MSTTTTTARMEPSTHERLQQMARDLKANGWGEGVDGITQQVIALDQIGVPDLIEDAAKLPAAMALIEDLERRIDRGLAGLAPERVVLGCDAATSASAAAIGVSPVRIPDGLRTANLRPAGCGSFADSLAQLRTDR